MKILYVVGEFPKLSETFVLSQITGLIDLGNDVDILALNNPNEKKIHKDIVDYNLTDKTTYLFPKSKKERIVKFFGTVLKEIIKNPVFTLRSLNFFKYGKDALSLKLYFGVLDREKLLKYDVIHCHFGNIGSYISKLKDMGIPIGKLYTTFHGYDVTAYLQKNGDDVYDILFKNGDIFLPISEFWKRKIIDLGCDESKIIVHHMGVDTSKFNYKAPKKTIKNIVSVARLVEKKGVKYSIKAVAELVNEYDCIQYSILGDGPLKNNLASLINELNAENHIKLLGWMEQKEIIKSLQEADLLIVPSVTSTNGDMEGIPVVIMEAMAMGIPVISTYHSGIPEIIESGKTGFLVEEKNSNELYQKLDSIIKENINLNEISMSAREQIENEFDKYKLNVRLNKIFENRRGS